ncbi:hypothetical protein ACQZ64_27090 [Rhizobium rhizogenes]
MRANDLQLLSGFLKRLIKINQRCRTTGLVFGPKSAHFLDITTVLLPLCGPIPHDFAAASIGATFDGITKQFRVGGCSPSMG